MTLHPAVKKVVLRKQGKVSIDGISTSSREEAEEAPQADVFVIELNGHIYDFKPLWLSRPKGVAFSELYNWMLGSKYRRLCSAHTTYSYEAAIMKTCWSWQTSEEMDNASSFVSIIFGYIGKRLPLFVLVSDAKEPNPLKALTNAVREETRKLELNVSGVDATPYDDNAEFKYDEKTGDMYLYEPSVWQRHDCIHGGRFFASGREIRYKLFAGFREFFSRSNNAVADHALLRDRRASLCWDLGDTPEDGYFDVWSSPVPFTGPNQWLNSRSSAMPRPLVHRDILPGRLVPTTFQEADHRVCRWASLACATEQQLILSRVSYSDPHIVWTPASAVLVVINDGDLIILLSYLVDHLFRQPLRLRQPGALIPIVASWKERFSTHCRTTTTTTKEPQIFYWNGATATDAVIEGKNGRRNTFEVIHINTAVDSLRNRGIPPESLLLLSCLVGNDYIPSSGGERMKIGFTKKKKRAPSHKVGEEPFDGEFPPSTIAGAETIQQHIATTPTKALCFDGVSQDTIVQGFLHELELGRGQPRGGPAAELSAGLAAWYGETSNVNVLGKPLLEAFHKLVNRIRSTRVSKTDVQPPASRKLLSVIEAVCRDWTLSVFVTRLS